MSKWAAEPDLITRRLRTLVRLLEQEANALDVGYTDQQSDGLTAAECRQWAELNKTYTSYTQIKPRPKAEDANLDLIA